MRNVHRSDCDDRCNGDWCECSCHRTDDGPTVDELLAQRAAIEAEQAKLRQLQEKLEVPE
jgi:hypothetical protein